MLMPKDKIMATLSAEAMPPVRVPDEAEAAAIAASKAKAKSSSKSKSSSSPDGKTHLYSSASSNPLSSKSAQPGKKVKLPSYSSTAKKGLREYPTATSSLFGLAEPYSPVASSNDTVDSPAWPLQSQHQGQDAESFTTSRRPHMLLHDALGPSLLSWKTAPVDVRPSLSRFAHVAPPPPAPEPIAAVADSVKSDVVDDTMESEPQVQEEPSGDDARGEAMDTQLGDVQMDDGASALSLDPSKETDCAVEAVADKDGEGERSKRKRDADEWEEVVEPEPELAFEAGEVAAEPEKRADDGAQGVGAGKRVRFDATADDASDEHTSSRPKRKKSKRIAAAAASSRSGTANDGDESGSSDSDGAQGPVSSSSTSPSKGKRKHASSSSSPARAARAKARAEARKERKARREKRARLRAAAKFKSSAKEEEEMEEGMCWKRVKPLQLIWKSFAWRTNIGDRVWAQIGEDGEDMGSKLQILGEDFFKLDEDEQGSQEVNGEKQTEDREATTDPSSAADAGTTTSPDAMELDGTSSSALSPSAPRTTQFDDGAAASDQAPKRKGKRLPSLEEQYIRPWDASNTIMLDDSKSSTMFCPAENVIRIKREWRCAAHFRDVRGVGGVTPIHTVPLPMHALVHLHPNAFHDLRLMAHRTAYLSKVSCHPFGGSQLAKADNLLCSCPLRPLWIVARFNIGAITLTATDASSRAEGEEPATPGEGTRKGEAGSREQGQGTGRPACCHGCIKLLRLGTLSRSGVRRARPPFLLTRCCLFLLCLFPGTVAAGGDGHGAGVAAGAPALSGRIRRRARVEGVGGGGRRGGRRRGDGLLGCFRRLMKISFMLGPKLDMCERGE